MILAARNACAGNVLFLILIAVALFAALSYAVTSSTRSGAGDTSKEQVQLIANQFEQFSTAIRQAYMRLRLNGCGRGNVYFDKVVGGQYFVLINYAQGGIMAGDGDSAVANSSCDLFSPNGGNVILPYGTADNNPVFFGKPGNSYGQLHFINNFNFVSTSSDDLFVQMDLTGADDVTVKVCEEINRRAGLPTSTANTFTAMSAALNPSVYALIGSAKLNQDLFCEGNAINIILDPR